MKTELAENCTAEGEENAVITREECVCVCGGAGLHTWRCGFCESKCVGAISRVCVSVVWRVCQTCLSSAAWNSSTTGTFSGNYLGESAPCLRP